MPKLLFITAPTPEVLYKSGKLEGKVRFPGVDKAVEELTAKGWEIEIIGPVWPGPLRKAEEWEPDAVLVATFKRVPIARDAASMMARMYSAPVYTLGVTQKDEAFRTMAPDANVLKNLREFPDPS
jgi:hypothetical protein